MKMTLKYKTLDVLDMDMEIFPEGIQITNIKVLDKESLPAGLKPAFSEKYRVSDTGFLLEKWLLNRSIPDYRQNIDDFVLSLHHLPHHLFGRMDGYQHTAAVLSYFTSYFDQYYVTPEKTELICFVNVDSRFKNLYLLEPTNNQIRKVGDNIDEYLKEKNDKIYDYKGSFQTMSFTIPSMAPSWWDEINGRTVLVQKCISNSDKKRAQMFISIAETVGLPGSRSFDGGYLYSDYGYMEGSDTTWLSEYVPYLGQVDPVTDQIKKFVNQEFRDDQILSKLLLTEQLMKQEGYSIALSELGIAKQKDKLEPVVIY